MEKRRKIQWELAWEGGGRGEAPKTPAQGSESTAAGLGRESQADTDKLQLRKRGIGKELAACTAGSAHGPWRLSSSQALHYALPNAFFDSLGLPALVR